MTAPTSTSTTPARRTRTAGWSGRFRRPNWSRTTAATIWPAMTNPNVLAAPRRGVTMTETTKERADQTAHPCPPRRPRELRGRGHHLPGHDEQDQKRHGADDKGDRRGRQRSPRRPAQLRVHRELYRQRHPPGERQERQEEQYAPQTPSRT